MTVRSCCPGCAHEQACGHAEVTMCANREPADVIVTDSEAELAALVRGLAWINGSAPIPGAPGCPCDGLRDALAARERYRTMALHLACRDKVGSYDAPSFGCGTCEHPDGAYCDTVIKEVDRG